MQDQVSNSSVRDIALPLYNAKFWMKLMGVVMIIYGAIMAITIVGLIIAWLPIWVGVLLFQSASAIDMAYNTDDRDAAIRALEKLKTYFVINGVLLLIGIVIGVIGGFLGGMGAFMGMQHIGGM